MDFNFGSFLPFYSIDNVAPDILQKRWGKWQHWIRGRIVVVYITSTTVLSRCDYPLLPKVLLLGRPDHDGMHACFFELSYYKKGSLAKEKCVL